jgi:hypothetical protein
LLSGCAVEALVRAAKERTFRLSAEVHSSKRRVDTLRKHCMLLRDLVWGLEVVCVLKRFS